MIAKRPVIELFDAETIARLKMILPTEDNENMDSDWHRAAMNLLIELVIAFYADRQDYFVGGNMFIHFFLPKTGRYEFRGPDVFLVKNVDGTKLRPYWFVEDEDNRFPDLIMELLSPSTADEDLTNKKDLYQDVFGTGEYFCYDPNAKELLGWRLDDSQIYQPIPANDKGWLWSEQLGLWIGTWDGTYQARTATWLRYFDDRGRLILNPVEAARQSRKQATDQREKTGLEKKRADAQHKRVEELELEVLRLKALLKSKGMTPLDDSE